MGGPSKSEPMTRPAELALGGEKPYPASGTTAPNYMKPRNELWGQIKNLSWTNNLLRNTKGWRDCLIEITLDGANLVYREKKSCFALVVLTPKNEKDLDAVVKLSQLEDFEVFKRSYGVNDSLDVLVPPHRRQLVLDLADSLQLNYTVKAENYKLIPDRQPRRRVFNGFNVFGYNSYSGIQDFIQGLAKKHSHLVTVEPAGTSYQGRVLNLVKISKSPQGNNPAIFVDAGIHAREWVAPAMALYLTHRLVLGADKAEELNGVDWYIMPLVNPDGYEFSRSSPANRLWRKTRSRSGLLNCYGVDGNRNYGFKWGASGTSSDPCNAETYAGPRPFSEPETAAVKNVMEKYSRRIKLYVSLHAYGQYLVYPWGYTGEFLPQGWERLDRLARKVSSAVVRAGGEPFKATSAGRWYAAAGGSDDYAFGAVGIPYSYTMELTRNYEFNFPERLLASVLPRYYEGFKAFAAQIKKEFGAKRYGKGVDVLGAGDDNNFNDTKQVI
ncbi:Carboxypeptidase B [Eumeta japonica]|uniref:Carboxypeptidase B n=1 Tax=Eumeta variegata TaxID=151549 RepID=A0A4C1XRX7_EUMVA|nr:Carboxypeptidase B [Eumeta japonica]